MVSQRICVATVVTVLLAGTLDLVSVGTTRGQGQSEGRAVVDRQNQLLARGGLRAAASVTGSFVGTAMPDEMGSPSSLKALIASAQTIVVATVESNRCELTADGHSIFTAYEVAVERPLKGAVDIGGKLSVVVPGGMVVFPDQTWARLVLPRFRLPENGKRYVFFLREATRIRSGDPVRTSSQRFVPAFGPLGVYLMSNPRTVYPAGNIKTPLGREVVALKLKPLEFIGRLENLLR